LGLELSSGRLHKKLDKKLGKNLTQKISILVSFLAIKTHKAKVVGVQHDN
jgi:hypothetical protein